MSFHSGSLFLTIIIWLILCPWSLSWTASWGRLVDDIDPRGYYIYGPKGELQLTVLPGTSFQSLRVNMCIPSGFDVVYCDTLLNLMFMHFYKVSYAPTIHTENYLVDYFATRGTILSMVMDKFGYSKSYLEIGTNANVIFSRARQYFELAVGVDPELGGTHRMTSDDYFENHVPANQTFELIFVDGFHEAHQVYRDVMNALKVLAPGGTIVMHDCNPTGDLDVKATYPRNPESFNNDWNGDTWKAAIALRLVPDLEIVVVDVDHGVGVVRQRQNQHPLEPHWIEYLAEDPFSALDTRLFKEFRRDFIRLLTLDQFVEWLDEE